MKNSLLLVVLRLLSCVLKEETTHTSFVFVVREQILMKDLWHRLYLITKNTSLALYDVPSSEGNKITKSERLHAINASV